MVNNCPLALECIDTSSSGCINAEACNYWTQAWDLYEIFLLGDLPAIYLDNGDYCEWTQPEYGFTRLNNCDFLLYYAAKYCSFEDWQRAYYKLNREDSAYIAMRDFEQIEKLRCSIDKDYGRELTEEDIPF